MSYILDALKRAESERERGVVPGLHSQSEPLRRPAADSRTVVKPLLLAGAALALTLLGVLAWRSIGPAAPGSAVPGIATTAPVPSHGVTATSAVPIGVSPATMLAPVAKRTPISIEQPGQTAAEVAKPIAEPRIQPKQQPVAVALAAPVPAIARILPLGELPVDVRQTLPKVVISGSTYSDNPAFRMVIINGEVFREGEKPATDLQLEQIKAKSAVLNFKGLRYSVAY